MPTQTDLFDESPPAEGPDYVALVIEWDELAEDLERQLRDEAAAEEERPARGSRTLVVVAAAIGAIVLVWGIARRLRA